MGDGFKLLGMAAFLSYIILVYVTSFYFSFLKSSDNIWHSPLSPNGYFVLFCS